MARPRNPRGQYRLNPLEATHKRCPNCCETKPVEEFSRNRPAPDGRQSYCRRCQSAHNQRNREANAARQRKYLSDPANRERHGLALRRGHLRREYGITPEDYDRMLAKQEGVCGICGGVQQRKIDGEPVRLAVDHCHDTGKVRGLLCNQCNKLLHKLERDSNWIEKACAYLK